MRMGSRESSMIVRPESAGFLRDVKSAPFDRIRQLASAAYPAVAARRVP